MTPPDLADVLAEVNRLRAERGLEPLGEMPKGHKFQATHCPLAVALSAFSCGITGWNATADAAKRGNREPMPPVLGAFVCEFDNGAYPELVAP